MDIAKDYSDAGKLEARLRDVQNPGTITNIVGSVKTDDPMDNDGDAFAEGEGAYTHSAASGVAHFTLGMNVTRYDPVFKIYNWTTAALPSIVTVNNQEKIRGYQYNAHVDGANNILIVAFNDTWLAPSDSAAATTPVKNIFISLKTGLAVTMHDSDFVAISAVGVDSLKWTTHSEIYNLGFKIKRRIKPGGKGLTLRATKATTASTDTVYKYLFHKLIPGAVGGRSSADRKYVFVDKTCKFGIIYEYILVAVDYNGLKQEFGPREASPTTPLVTKLYGNYPNPFNPATTIRFDLRAKTKLALNIYNIKGQLVRRLITPNKALNAGQYRYQWNARNDNGVDVPTGHYIIFFVTKDGYKKARKMTLLK